LTPFVFSLPAINSLDSTHIRTQHFWHRDRAISGLIILHDSHQRSPDSHSRAIQGMQ